MYLPSNHVQLIGILFNATLNLDSVSMYPFCKNAREFVIRFHDEGRHEYDAECGIDRLEKRIDVAMDPNNPAVAADKYFSEDYEFTRSDLPIFRGPMDLFLKISVLHANFCWLGDLDKIICPWKLENCGCLRC